MNRTPMHATTARTPRAISHEIGDYSRLGSGMVFRCIADPACTFLIENYSVQHACLWGTSGT